tara:strand:+ start:1425 stop:1691 length:267 start_codon:yes stop_codon:yes gene_type:complete
MYSLKVDEVLFKKLEKLRKKNKKQFEIIMKKAEEIIQNPRHYKNLRAPLQHWKRVHIDRHFVLTFSVDEETKTITLEDFDHHDNIYNH